MSRTCAQLVRRITLTGHAQAALDLFAGVPVTDYAAALPWYERFFGWQPSFLPNDIEA